MPLTSQLRGARKLQGLTIVPEADRALNDGDACYSPKGTSMLKAGEECTDHYNGSPKHPKSPPKKCSSPKKCCEMMGWDTSKDEKEWKPKCVKPGAGGDPYIEGYRGKFRNRSSLLC